jgi:hypothetical protein
MSKLWIREYSALQTVGARYAGDVASGVEVAPISAEPGTDQSPVTFSSSAQSAAFADGTLYIRMIADAAFHYVVGTNPTATTNHLKVPADTLLEIGVKTGHKIAAIAAA